MNKKAFIQENDSAWNQIKSRFVILLAREDGTIKEVVSDGRFSERELLQPLIEKQGSLFDFFDFGEAKSLKESAEKVVLYNARPIHDLVKGHDLYYVDLPLFNVSINPRDDDLYLAVISPTRVISALSVNPALPSFFVDRNKKLRAYNEAFAKLIGKKDQAQLLNIHLDEMLYPWLDVLSDESLEKNRNSNYVKLAQGQEAVLEGIGTEENKIIRLIDNELIDNKKIKLKLSATVERGDGPIFLLGDGASYDRVVCGASAARKNIAVYKKNGYVVWDGKFNNVNEGSRGSWEWIIDKKHIELREGSGKEFFCYRDFEGVAEGKIIISLALRKDTILKDINWQIDIKKEEISDDVQLFKFKSIPEKSFLMHYLFHPGLASSFPDVCAYGLQEVTCFVKDKTDDNDSFKGESDSIVKIKASARIAAKTDATILIEGETGTGKGALALYIHRLSSYSSKEMVIVDCSSIPSQLIESELFGVEKGAFTGAVERRAGKLEQADGTTLFLDEINSLSIEVQSRLLRFLEDFSVTRIGGTKSKKLNLRVIAAANSPLMDLVNKGLFRKDLYYRLCALSLKIPPLRDRKEDITFLASIFLKKSAAKFNKEISGFDHISIRHLINHNWPGNIRELKNVIERAVLFCEKKLIAKEDLGLFENIGGKSDLYKREKFRLNISKDKLIELLEEHKGNIKALSRTLDCSRSTIYYNLRT